MKLQPRSFIPYVILIALVVSTTALQPNIISLDWLGIKTNTILPLALATAGQTLVLFTGGIDLSIGGVISLTNSLEATKMEAAPPTSCCSPSPCSPSAFSWER